MAVGALLLAAMKSSIAWAAIGASAEMATASAARRREADMRVRLSDGGEMRAPRLGRRFCISGSKTWRRAGADHLAGFCANAAKPVRPTAFEIIGVAGIEDMALVVDGHLQPAGDHHAAFLALMHQRHPAGVAARLVALFQNLQGAAEQIVADLAIRDRFLADLGQFVGPVKGFLLSLRLDGEEFGQPHRNTVENTLERA